MLQRPIEVGKYADMIVLDRNLFEMPPTQVGETKALTTLFEGRGLLGDESVAHPRPMTR